MASSSSTASASSAPMVNDSNGVILTLASLEGRLPDRVDGRPRRKHSIPLERRCQFMEVLNDNRKRILVYITPDGRVRQDTDQVLDELRDSGEFSGISDKWYVDIPDMMKDKNTEDDRDLLQPARKRHKHTDEDHDFDALDDESNDEESNEYELDGEQESKELKSGDQDYEEEEEEEEDDEDEDDPMSEELSDAEDEEEEEEDEEEEELDDEDEDYTE
jgi:hypothetical protein